MRWMAATQRNGSLHSRFESHKRMRLLNQVFLTRWLICITVAWGVGTLPIVAQDDFRGRPDSASPDRSGFNWAAYSTSPADLLIQDPTVFRQGTSSLNIAEQQAWRELLDEVTRRRQALKEEDPKNATARWESAFYRFADVRRIAWKNKSLRLEPARPKGKSDPFRLPGEAASTEVAEAPDVTEYSVITDILNHAEDFVGKPVVLRGVLERPQSAATGDDRLRPDASGPLLSGLSSFDGAKPLAWVRTSGVHRTSGEDPGIDPWPVPGSSRLPVLVKGWVVKLWGDGRPLIYCDSVREISVQPPTALIRKHAASRRPLLDQEAWLYYEVLSSQEMIQKMRTAEGQRFWQVFQKENNSPLQTANAFLKTRLDDLLREIAEKFEADKATLEQNREMKRLSASDFDVELKRLYYLVNERIGRYSKAKENLHEFAAYVDLFMNPDVWKGQLVTLRGHVRHAVSYPAQHPEFRGRTLHELWLFTDDSQSNPAVVVTARLPEDFPVEAELIDQVAVTGCVFKQYVYRGQETRRIAPLILAGTIQWTPTDRHILALQESGHLSSSSPLAQRARLARSQGPGGTALLLVGFVAMLFIMVLWGRAQRDRRERRNLMNRIAERPEFETSLGGQYAPRLSDYTSGYDL